MKTKPTAPRMPRARVFITRNVNATSATPKAQRNNYTAVIPTATAQQARKLAAFWNLAEEERVERITDIMRNAYTYQEAARAVLSAITGCKAEGG